MVAIDLLSQGFPGRSPTHGALGWGTIALLRAGDRNVLVDTGGPSVHKLLMQRLKGRGLAPRDIHLVVLSHCHWDHSMGLPFFPEAEVVIGRKELEWALSVNQVEQTSVPVYLMRQLADNPRLRLVEGDTELLPGITTIDTPGHTPGHISMVVSAEEGTVVMAQDAVKNRAEFLSRTAEQSLDAAASTASIERIASLAKVVIPGHDRAFRIEGDGVVYTSELKVEIAARLSPSMDEQTVFSITMR